MRKPGILAILTLALIAVLSPTATAQEARTPASPTVAVARGTTADSADPSGTCYRHWTGDGPTDATYLCDTNIQTIRWLDGRYELFVVGTDRQIWHSYQYSDFGSYSPWGTLGDSNNVRDGVWAWFTGSSPTVQVRGGDNQLWCNVYSGGWSNWHVCT